MAVRDFAAASSDHDASYDDDDDDDDDDDSAQFILCGRPPCSVDLTDLRTETRSIPLSEMCADTGAECPLHWCL